LLAAVFVMAGARGAAASPKGFSLRLGLGSNTCVASGSADCAGQGTHLGLSGAVGYRVVSWLGLYADANLGWLDVAGTSDPPASASFQSLSVTPMVRAFLPIEPLELSLGVGLGYARATLEVTTAGGQSGGVSWSSWLSPRVVGGLGVPINSWLTLGVSAAMQIHSDGSGKYCFLDGDCHENSLDVTDLVQVSGVCMATF
jgi:hypothetical protein